MNICMAHRGWSSKAPENTMAAIELAVKEPRIQAIEVDVQLTKDHVPVVIHDYTVNRTTNGRGLVRLFTYEQLRTLDAGSWFSDDYKGQKVPSLEEVLLTVGGRSLLNLDLKVLGSYYPRVEAAVVSVIEKYRMQNDVIITSFQHRFISYLNQQLDRKLCKGLNVVGNPYLLPSMLKQTDSKVASMKYVFLTDKAVAWLQENKYITIAWTVNDPEHIKELMERYPNIIICTDYPQRMIPFM